MAAKSIHPAAEIIRGKLDAPVSCAVILGSGHGSEGIGLKIRHEIDYRQLPDFPTCSVPGHPGELHLAALSDRSVLIFHGRFHRYEGFGWKQIAAPLELCSEIGCDRIVLCSSAGGLDPGMETGDVMVVADHINLMGESPLRELAPFDPDRSFLDLSGLYWTPSDEQLTQAARDAGVRAARGVLAAVGGPAYETPAEIRMLKTLGADAVCMSTVPEALIAAHCGMRVCALSLITNMCSAHAGGISHGKVLESASAHGPAFTAFVGEILKRFVP